MRWQPSTEAVAGYRVWVRPATGSYGAPREAGMPTRDANGNYSMVVAGLDPRTDYAVAVSAYTNATGESGRSNEVQIGYAQVAPIMDSDTDGLRDASEDRNLNRTVDAGETDPMRADTDGDGVGDAADQCSGTAGGAAVNPQGCSCAQVTCDDGNACNGAETCQAGVCRPGSAPSCDDGNPCTTDGCRAASGCTHTAVPSCSSCTANSQCDDGNPCTTDVCSSGTCRSSAANNGTSCSDGNSCNGDETCQAGACRPGTAVSCDDGNACTTDTCNPGTGCAHAPVASCTACTANAQCNDNNPCTTDVCSGGTCQRNPAANGTACGDGNACNGNETCQAGACRAGTALSCDDGDGCTTDTCSPQSGCAHAPDAACGACPNATVLPAAGGTVSGTTAGTRPSRFTATCEATTGKTSDAVYAWTPTRSGTATISTCGAATRFDTVLSLKRGSCDRGEELACNDDSAGCAVDNSEANADHNGSRVTVPVTAGETYYIVVDGYDGKAGAFTLTVTSPTACTAAACDDGNACTTDACSASGACTHTAVAGCSACTGNAQCDDGNACNGAETCQAGRCAAGSAPTCNDGNTCTTDSCNPSTGCVYAPVAGCSSCTSNAQCDDGNACTTDVCTAGRCQRQNVADGASCSDSNVCNGAETCQAGRCSAGRALTCDDGNTCTQDSCNPTSGCTAARIAGCSACTTAAECDDQEACTADACVNGRCTVAPVADGTSCTDGNFCDGLETCQAGRCAAGTAPDCNDDNSCTTDTCDPAAGQCTHASQEGCCASDAECADTDACTTNERCEAGKCVTTPTTCEKPGPCQEGVCDPTTGCATVALADGTACDDGDPCTKNEKCSAGVCEVRATSVAAESTGSDLSGTEFVLKRSNKRVWKLSAEGYFGMADSFDPISSGLTFGVLEADGTLLYEATIPAGAFVWKKNRFYYKAGDSDADYVIQKVEIKPEDGNATVKVSAKVPPTVAVTPEMEALRRGRRHRHVAAALAPRKLTWTISVGDSCVRDRTVNCPTNKSSSKRCS